MGQPPVPLDHPTERAGRSRLRLARLQDAHLEPAILVGDALAGEDLRGALRVPVAGCVGPVALVAPAHKDGLARAARASGALVRQLDAAPQRGVQDLLPGGALEVPRGIARVDRDLHRYSYIPACPRGRREAGRAGIRQNPCAGGRPGVSNSSRGKEEPPMNIFKAMAVKELEEATRAIPVIDFGPAFRGAGRARCRGAHRCGTRASRSASSISPGTACRRRSSRPRSRPRASFTRCRSREDAASINENNIGYLPVNESMQRAFDRAQGHPAQLQRELLHQLRPGRRPSRRRGRQAAARPQPVARRPRPDAARDGRYFTRSRPWASGCCPSSPARSTCPPITSPRSSRTRRTSTCASCTIRHRTPTTTSSSARGRTPTTRSSRSSRGWTCRGWRSGCRAGSGWRRR